MSQYRRRSRSEFGRCLRQRTGAEEKVRQVHVWRPRRSRFGELAQWDNSEHDWLEGRRRDQPAVRALRATRFDRGYPICVLEAWRNLSVRCGLQNQPRGRILRPPASRSRSRLKERAGRITLLSSSAMSLRPAIPRMVGRHQWNTRLARLDKEGRNRVASSECVRW
jgi:hypothetical protein